MKTCKRGHPQTKNNVYTPPGETTGRCKRCKNEYNRSYGRTYKRTRTPKPWTWDGDGVYVGEARDRFSSLITGAPTLIIRRYQGPVALIVPKNVSKSAMLKAWEEMQK